MGDALWTPSIDRIQRTNMYQFMQKINQSFSINLTDYQQLHQWSVDHTEQFWDQVWQHTAVVSSVKGDQILLDGDKMPGARWFPEARLNFAENLLRDRDQKTALIFRTENKTRIELSYAELYKEVAQLASSLRKRGIAPGDRIAGFMPNVPSTVIAMLAAASVGAVWTSCSPDFGINGVLDRFGQVKPRLLITTDGYWYNGRTLSNLEKVKGIAEHLDKLEAVVVVPLVGLSESIAEIPNACYWDDFIDQNADEVRFEQLPFDHPLYVMYSSGTTGVPKCIVHSAGGTLIQHLKEHALHTDLCKDDTLFYYTTCGWMMWNWLVSGLALGATVLLYDGSPFAPTPSVLWDIAEQENISVFGTSAKYLSALEKAGVKPRETHNLSNLKAVLSTGSPLSHESFEYVYRDIKTDLLLASISGGTDILSCFALGCPIRPVYAGQLQCRGLGMAVEIFNDEGNPVYQEKGELVCTKPFPSMPISFWDDANGEKFHSAYFDLFDNIWAHGDYGELTSEDGLIIHGRSDAVLNPGGVRIGTAEIYRQVEQIDEVLESLCIGQPWKDDVRVVLFVRLRDDQPLTDELIQRIKQQIRSNTTPRHVPSKVVKVVDIPRTISGKIVELAVRKMVMNEPVKNRDALANPEALELFKNIPELQS